MGPTSSNEAGATLSAQEGQTLLALASASIEHGLRGKKLRVDADVYPQRLRQQGASFVTLRLHGELRGCIGSIEAKRPLVIDVARNAHAAAFDDPRFPALALAEHGGLDVHISVLSALESIACACEDDVILVLRPGIDGVVIEEGRMRATYLPSVWDSLPEPREFLRQLKRKAGLSPDHWSAHMRVRRYTIQTIS